MPPYQHSCLTTPPFWLLLTLLVAAIDAATSVCNSSISNANISSVYTFAPNFEDPSSLQHAGEAITLVPEPSWAITVTGDGTTSLWYDTAGENYADDLAIGYDVCAFIVSNLPLNTLELGQDDPGDCSTTLSGECIKALTDRAALSATKWTTYSSPPPYENLTAGVLPTLCSYIFNDLGEQGSPWPEQCWPELGYDPNNITVAHSPLEAVANVIPLTGYNSTVLREDCTLSSGNKSFFYAYGRSSTLAQDLYANASHAILPTLTVYFSVANVKRTSFTNGSNSTMRCLRAKNVSEGSRVVDALPAGTPYSHDSGKHLSGGAIAGIVIGVLAGVAIVAGVVVLWCLRRRRQRRAGSAEAKTHGDQSEDRKDGTELEGTAMNEMSAVPRKAELHSNHVAEMAGSDNKRAELDAGGRGRPTELEGNPVVR